MTDAQLRLFEAVANGDANTVCQALEDGGDVNAGRGDRANESYESPLEVAALHGHYKIVELLLQRGATVNDGYMGSTGAMFVALLSGRVDIANLLYRYGALSGLLLGFCFTDNYAAVHEILHLQPHRWPEYALDSIRSGNVEMLTENLRRNPTLHPKKDGHGLIGSTIFQWRLVHRWGAKGKGIDDGFDRQRYQTMTRMLLEWGADPNGRNDKGETLLHACASGGRDWSPSDAERAGHARILIEHGADVNIADAAGETPLARAARLQRQALRTVLETAGDCARGPAA